MKQMRWRAVAALALAAFLFLVFSPSSSQSQTLERNFKMTCIECHADPSAGGIHGGFRGLTDLTEDEIDTVCMDCHDGTYTNAQGVTAPETAVHTVSGGQFGTWKIGCRGCHSNHYNLLAGDGSGGRNIKMLGTRVPEVSATDGIARIRQPFIVDTLGNDGTAPESSRHQDDEMQGYYCGDNPVTSSPNLCTETVPISDADTVRRLTFLTDLVDNSQLATNPWANNWAQGLKVGNKYQDIPPIGDLGNTWDRWYDGACNVCHKRETTHHKRDNLGDPAERNHNLQRNAAEGCTECHNHKDFFTNRK